MKNTTTYTQQCLNRWNEVKENHKKQPSKPAKIRKELSVKSLMGGLGRGLASMPANTKKAGASLQAKAKEAKTSVHRAGQVIAGAACLAVDDFIEGYKGEVDTQ